MSGPARTFGRNWRQYLGSASAEQIDGARTALLDLVGAETIKGARFIDLGSGSGVHSLAAVDLGAAQVISIDLDPDSVAATKQLQASRPGAPWQVVSGSVLEPKVLGALGRADVVYSWGVLHHTGSMWLGLSLAAEMVRPGGVLAIALYNRTRTSSFWLGWKQCYLASPAPVRWLMVQALFAPRALVRLLRGRHPLKEERGMSIYRDAVDWCLGYPYEYAGFEEIKNFVEFRGFKLSGGHATSGSGCNEFVFRRNDAPGE